MSSTRARRLVAGLLLAIAVRGPTASAAGPGDAVPDVPQNKAWDVDDTSATYTGGGRGPATIQIVLTKAAISGRPLSIRADGDHLQLTDANPADVPVTLTLSPPGPPGRGGDGFVSSVVLVVGPHPSVSVDGKESIPENGHWRRIARGADPSLVLSITNATFASIGFAAPAAAVPPPPPPIVMAQGPVAKPRPLLPPLRPVKLQLATQAFAEAVSRPCSTCNGKGRVPVQVQIGVTHTGAFAVPTMQTQLQVCTRCNGTGFLHADPSIILGKAGDLVHDLIVVDMSDPTAQDVVKATYDAVTTNAIGNRRCWDVLTKDARSTLSLAQPRVGTPLIAEVIVDSALTAPTAAAGSTPTCRARPTSSSSTTRRRPTTWPTARS